MSSSAPARLAPRRKPRQQRSRLTVDCLLEATARVLVARGWAGTTTNHVAQQAGVSVGTLYEYFPGKEALASALLERHLEEAEARLTALSADLAPERLTLEALVGAMVATMLDLHAASPRLHRVLFEEVPQGPATRARVRAMEERQAGLLAALLPGLGVVRDPAITARLVVELLEALTHRWLVAPGAGPLPRARLQGELERLVLAYLRAG